MMIFWMESDPLDPLLDSIALTSPETGHVILNVVMAAQYPMRRVEYIVSIVTDIIVEGLLTMSTDIQVMLNNTL